MNAWESWGQMYSGADKSVGGSRGHRAGGCIRVVLVSSDQDLPLMNGRRRELARVTGGGPGTRSQDTGQAEGAGAPETGAGDSSPHDTCRWSPSLRVSTCIASAAFLPLADGTSCGEGHSCLWFQLASSDGKRVPFPSKCLSIPEKFSLVQLGLQDYPLDQSLMPVT